MQFKEIPLFRFGNEITISGLVMQDISGTDIVVLLPNEKPQSELKTILPTTEEWYQLQDQLDKCNVQGEAGTILRKGQRNLDYGSWLQHKYYIEKSKFLSEGIRLSNEAIVKNLSNLPKMSKQRSR